MMMRGVALIVRNQRKKDLRLLRAFRSVRLVGRRTTDMGLASIAKAIYARPNLRSAIVRALDRFPTIKRQLKAAFSQAGLRSRGMWNSVGRGHADVGHLSRYAARVYKDLERERLSVAARKVPGSR
jgi:hypothetical protein